jgi:hypothetical protein
MNNPQNIDPLDQLNEEIESQHQEMSAAEQAAALIDEKLRQIPGIEGFMRTPRPFGTTRNPWATGNMTAQAAIIRADRPLAVWLASKAGKSLPPVDYAERNRQMTETEQMERFIQKTDELRQKRMAMQQQHANRRLHGVYNPAAGKVII